MVSCMSTHSHANYMSLLNKEPLISSALLTFWVWLYFSYNFMYVLPPFGSFLSDLFSLRNTDFRWNNIPRPYFVYFILFFLNHILTKCAGTVAKESLPNTTVFCRLQVASKFMPVSSLIIGECNLFDLLFCLSLSEGLQGEFELGFLPKTLYSL